MSQQEFLRRKSSSENDTIPNAKLFPSELQTKKEVAKVLRISIRALETWMKSGELKFIRLGKKMIRFNPDYLNRKFGG